MNTNEDRDGILQVAPPKWTPFLSVSATAKMLGISDVTLYRAIAAGEFPAVRVRGRLIIPSKAVEAMVNAAVDAGAVVDAAVWVPEQRVAVGKAGER